MADIIQINENTWRLEDGFVRFFLLEGKDKAIMITRYPIEDYQNIYPSLMNIIPYSKTKVATVNGVTYPRFPCMKRIMRDAV